MASVLENGDWRTAIAVHAFHARFSRSPGQALSESPKDEEIIQALEDVNLAYLLPRYGSRLRMRWIVAEGWWNVL